MSITPLDPANFNPSLKGITKYGAFRFWCQQVLPLTFDDSLSYYELLNKVVDYLNRTMENVNDLGSDVESLGNAYKQLEDYVNEYFSSLDVQQEINNKLDEMASDGTLNDLFDSVVASAADRWLNENVTPVGSTVALDASLTLANAAAQAKAVGDEFNNSIRRSLLNNETDLNNVKATGWYTMTYATNYTNLPENEPSNNQRRQLVVYSNPGLTYCVQVLYNISKGKIYQRLFTSNSWGLWRGVASEENLNDYLGFNTLANLFEESEIDGITTYDFNLVKKWGMANLPINTNYHHQPETPANARRYIITLKSASTLLYQLMFVKTSDESLIFQRVYAENTWGEWVSSHVELGEYLGYKSFGNETDLNNIRETGWYPMTYGTVYTNLPDNEPSNNQRRQLLVFKRLDSTYCVQILCNISKGKIYQRVFASSTWGLWRGVASDEDLNEYLGFNTLANLFEESEIGGITTYDFNLVKKWGMANLPINTNYHHQPETPANARRYIITLKSASTLLYQLMFVKTSDESLIFQRVYAENTWGEWVSSHVELGEYLGFKLTNDETNLDNIKEMGWYNLTYATNYTGLPSSEPSNNQRRQLFVFKRVGATYVIQYLFNISKGKIYQRLFTNNTWNKWRSCVSEEELNNTINGSFKGRIVQSHAGVYTNAKYENSPKAMYEARKLGITRNACDVVFTQDLIPVVAHSSFADNAIRKIDGDTSRIYFRDHTLADLKENYWFGDENYKWTLQTLEEVYNLNRDLGCELVVDIGGGLNNPQGAIANLIPYMSSRGINPAVLATSEISTIDELFNSNMNELSKYNFRIVIANLATDSHEVATQKVNRIISLKNAYREGRGIKYGCGIRRERIEEGGDIVTRARGEDQALIQTILQNDLEISAYSYETNTALIDIPTFVNNVTVNTGNLNSIRFSNIETLWPEIV